MGIGILNPWPEWVRKLYTWWTTARCMTPRMLPGDDPRVKPSGVCRGRGRVRLVNGTRVSVYCDRCLRNMGLPEVNHLERG